ncbi:sugar phosphate nucleotidyltransferase, partial [Oleiphilus sp. HI0066]|uniref:sugar phosphate nucleotidyltransferase n=3 Tax=Oleiphilus TaxID=141450 RepID=UPI000B1E6420
MKAMILAAGLGSRMRPLTDTCPKPLLKVGDKTLIDLHLERLEALGIKDIAINTHWLGEKIESHIDAVWRNQLNIQLFNEASL